MSKKQIKKHGKTPSRLSTIVKAVASFVSNHPMLVAIVIYCLYFFFFQHAFLFSTDVWAETHAEYLDDALKQKSFWDIFSYGWAGYITFLPSLAATLYVESPWPLGYADVFFQAVIVPSSILIAAFTAAKFNRALIKSDILRILLGLGLLMLLQEKSTFTIINVWYMGFVPLILICLNPQRLSIFKQVLYVLFGAAMAITKPAAILLPFVIYRAVKTKEWLSNGLLLLAVSIQTWVMVALDPRESASKATHDLVIIFKAVFVGAAVEFLKLLHITPTSLAYIFVANLVLLGIALLLWKSLGWIRAGLLSFGFVYSIYSYILAPDTVVYQGVTHYSSIYNFNYKVQREYLIYVFILLAIFLVLPVIYGWLAKLKSKRLSPILLKTLGLLIVLCGLGLIYRPIDVESAGVAANVEPFRNSISEGQSVCLPLPPTPAYFENNDFLWRFEFNTQCYAYNASLMPDYKRFNTSLEDGVDFRVANIPKQPLKTIFVVVENERPHEPGTLKLKDKVSGKSYTASVPPRSKENINFIPINVSGLPNRQSYNLELSSEDSNLKWGKFKASKSYACYPMFGPTRQPSPSR